MAAHVGKSSIKPFAAQTKQEKHFVCLFCEYEQIERLRVYSFACPELASTLK